MLSRMEQRTASQIIDALGGTKVVAEGLNLTMPAVSNWRKAKIPPERWSAVVAKFPITYEQLAAQLPPPKSKPKRRRRAA